MSERAAQKAKTRGRILVSMQRLLLQNGLSGTSVDRLMKKIGLTVGGFYAHFQSKDELALLAIRELLLKGRVAMESLPHPRWQNWRVRYLSPAHRDKQGEGCPLLAVVGDAVESSAVFRSALGQLLQQEVEARINLFSEQEPVDKEQILSSLATLVGAQMLARATRGHPISDDILHSAKQQLRG